jgi:hypothetical protein
VRLGGWVLHRQKVFAAFFLGSGLVGLETQSSSEQSEGADADNSWRVASQSVRKGSGTGAQQAFGGT